MRISDWSSDVCSSDLPDRLAEMAPGFPDDEDRLVGGLEAQCRHFPVIGEQPYAADRGRRQNGRSAPRRLALVIERAVAGQDREVQRDKARTHAIEAADEQPGRATWGERGGQTG